MCVDLHQKVTFLSEIASSSHCVFIIELTVPLEDAIDEAFERKKLCYAGLALEADQRGWKVRVRPVEVGCRGFLAFSTTRLLKEFGIRGLFSILVPSVPT